LKSNDLTEVIYVYYFTNTRHAKSTKKKVINIPNPGNTV
jgi:hypothetical protein